MKTDKKKYPPYLALKLLETISDYSFHIPVIGDVEELYFDRIDTQGRIKAGLWIWKQVFRSLPVFLSNSIYRSSLMFNNYIKITFRNLRKNKIFSLINIAGLAVGMACCILIMAYINFELSYDKFNENADDIYRVAVRGQISGRFLEIATLAAPQGPNMVKDFPEVISAVRFRETGKKLIRYEDNVVYETGILYADSSVFNVFSFELVQGDPCSALKNSYTMVISEEAAVKYFGNTDPVGKILEMDDEEFTITGVMKKPPKNSHLQFDILVSFETLYKANPTQMNAWFNFNYVTYILLQEGYDPADLEAKMDDFLNNYIGFVMKAAKMDIHNFLQPLTSIHLHSDLLAEISQNSDIKYIYTFSAVGLLILIIACINFMNLSSARSAKRAKEVGMRKVLGAERGKLFNQFIGESMFLACISLVTAVILSELALPFFNSIAGLDLEINYLQDRNLLAGVLGITLIAGLLAGIYPALVLSGFRPIQVLKAGLMKKAQHSGFRSILVVSQFSISIALIIGTGIIFSQLEYLKKKELGFKKEQLLVIQFDYQLPYERIKTIKTEMMNIEGVVKASAAHMAPGEESVNTSGYFPEGRAMSESVMMENFSIDPDFVETLGIEIIDGRGFMEDSDSDLGKAILINETALKVLDWDKPVGKIIREMINTRYELGDLTVVGVIKDFHQRSLHKKIEPLILDFKPGAYRRIILNLSTENIANTMSAVENKWREIELGRPFEYYFLDEYFDRQYRAEEKLGGIIRAFAVFALFIGCLGLFGLASFTTEQRTKEIGVRKVLGSNVISIVYLLCREFVILILIANVIAWPSAYFIMKNWLKNFPYQTAFGLDIFLTAGFLAIAIAVLTVTYQSVKAAYSNPVNSLRYE
ncbi:ABC transporter permease [candidate division KSB1 bacterium]